MKLWAEALLVIGSMAIVAVVQRASAPAEEAVVAEAAGRAEERIARFDPNRPPSAIQAQCRLEGKEFFAWRDSPQSDWQYRCVDAWLRPEVLIVRR